jgi:phospholipase C
MPDVLAETIKHIVVLMLENRSFDSMLGQLYPKTDRFEGLSGQESNPAPNGGPPILVWNNPGTDVATMSTPSPDPGELWMDINTQLFGTTNPATGAVPSMQGFAHNYINQTDPPAGTFSARDIMHFYSVEQLPVLSRLARQFAVCDSWHASAPCQTWPNRFFVHTGTAGGYENNAPPHFPYEMPTVFDLLEEREPQVSWKIYFHDFPQSLTLARLWPHLDRFRLFDEFSQDAKAGTLPSYSFIEPRYFADLHLPNDQHPPHVVTLGEQLIADIYNTLRSSPAWTQTLLIITCDEHGGCYDHVAPPNAAAPSSVASQPFNFDRYGVRVPAVLVSPFIHQGTVLRPPSGSPPFDHTSIIKTLRHCFGLGDAPISRREAAAPHVGGALTLDTPDNLGPSRIEALPYTPSPTDLIRARDMPPNHLQLALAQVAAHLPGQPQKPANFVQYVVSHIAQLKGAPPIAVPVHASVGDAAQFVKKELGDFFRNI